MIIDRDGSRYHLNAIYADTSSPKPWTRVRDSLSFTDDEILWSIKDDLFNRPGISPKRSPSSKFLPLVKRTPTKSEWFSEFKDRDPDTVIPSPKMRAILPVKIPSLDCRKQPCFAECSRLAEAKFRKGVAKFNSKKPSKRILGEYSLTKYMCATNRKFVNQDSTKHPMRFTNTATLHGEMLDGVGGTLSHEEMVSTGTGWNVKLKGLIQLENEAVNLRYGQNRTYRDTAFLLTRRNRSVNVKRVDNLLQSAKRKLTKLHPRKIKKILERLEKEWPKIPFTWGELLDSLPYFKVKRYAPLSVTDRARLRRIDATRGSHYAAAYTRRTLGKEYALDCEVRKDPGERAKQLQILAWQSQFQWLATRIKKNDSKQHDDEDWQQKMVANPSGTALGLDLVAVGKFLATSLWEPDTNPARIPPGATRLSIFGNYQPDNRKAQRLGAILLCTWCFFTPGHKICATCNNYARKMPVIKLNKFTEPITRKHFPPMFEMDEMDSRVPKNYESDRIDVSELDSYWLSSCVKVFHLTSSKTTLKATPSICLEDHVRNLYLLLRKDSNLFQQSCTPITPGKPLFMLPDTPGVRYCPVYHLSGMQLLKENGRHILRPFTGGEMNFFSSKK